MFQGELMTSCLKAEPPYLHCQKNIWIIRNSWNVLKSCQTFAAKTALWQEVWTGHMPFSAQPIPTTQGAHSYLFESGFKAYCMLHSPTTPRWRMTLMAAVRSKLYSMLVSVWLGATTIDSPVCMPSGSTFSMLHTCQYNIIIIITNRSCALRQNALIICTSKVYFW